MSRSSLSVIIAPPHYMKTRLLLSFLGLCLGLGILVLSLFSKSEISANQTGSSAKQIYMGEILPDHVAYPLIAGMDRFYLETATPVERIHFEIKYSHRRLEYAKALLEKGEARQDLALTTLTKSQKYLLKACREMDDVLVPDSTHQLLVRALAYNIDQMNEIVHSFPDYQRSIIDALRGEEEIRLEQLRNSSPN